MQYKEAEKKEGRKKIVFYKSNNNISNYKDKRQQISKKKFPLLFSSN